MKARSAFLISIISTVTFAALLVILHLMRSDLDPSWHFISEYAIGPNGWMMDIAFVAWASCFAFLAIGYRAHVRGVAGLIGAIMLGISASGAMLAALFTTDPIDTPSGQATFAGTMHALGGTLGMAMPVAVAIVSWFLVRSEQWRGHRPIIIMAAVFSLASFVFALTSLVTAMGASGGSFGPNVKVGWPLRCEILGYCIWTFIVARIGAILKSPSRAHLQPQGAIDVMTLS